jgi:hypothetical protein
MEENMADHFPDKVRVHAIKMRDLMKTIETAPLQQVVAAIANMKAEIDALFASTDAASGRRM